MFEIWRVTEAEAKDSTESSDVKGKGRGEAAKDGQDGKEGLENDPSYNIEFTFDSDVRVAITIYYFANEEITNGQAM